MCVVGSGRINEKRIACGKIRGLGPVGNGNYGEAVREIIANKVVLSMETRWWILYVTRTFVIVMIPTD